MNRIKLLFIIFLYILSINHNSKSQNVVINEVMSLNSYTIMDEDGDFSDWIELYNNSDNSISILNFSLSDDYGDLNKWIFPEVTIPAQSFLLVFASGKNRLDTNELHTNFKIKSSGEELFLSNSSSTIIDQIDSIGLSENETYGRLPDGSDYWLKLFSPTPFYSNNVNNQLFLSYEGGFYASPFYLKITSLLGDTVYYTLDGSIPSENSIIYTDSLFMDYKYSSPNFFAEIPTSPEQSLINYKAWEAPSDIIDKASILRCATYKNGKRTSKIFTQTFFIDSIIFGKYNMPVISLVTDSENLFSSDSGNYVPGIHYDLNNPEWTGNYFQNGDEWEKPVHIEYYGCKGEIGFSQDAGIKIHGSKTRIAAQKSMRLYARQEYGEEYFNYQLLPQKQNNKYKRFLLRTSMGAWGSQTIIKDVLAHEIVRDLDIEYQEYQPAVVYINGEYWGIHTIRNIIDERYIEYTYEINKDSVDIINGNYNIVEAGSNEHYVELVEFIELNDLSYENNYEYVKTQIDINNYIHYQISEIFFANFDWPGNNMKLWRPQTSNGKWRWIFFDLDAGFGNYNYNMFIHSTMNDSNITWPNSPSSTFLFRNLLKNNSFVNLFLEKFAEVLNQDFDVSTMVNKLNIIKQLYENEVPRHISRWNYPDSYSKWESDIEDDLLTFVKKRACFVEYNLVRFFDLSEFSYTCNMSDVEPNVKLVIAPNPNDGIFFIYNNSTISMNGNITITDVTGKIVYFKNDVSLEKNEKRYFNLTELPGNTYILNFYSINFSERKKIVIIN